MKKIIIVRIAWLVSITCIPVYNQRKKYHVYHDYEISRRKYKKYI